MTRSDRLLISVTIVAVVGLSFASCAEIHAKSAATDENRPLMVEANSGAGVYGSIVRTTPHVADRGMVRPNIFRGPASPALTFPGQDAPAVPPTRPCHCASAPATEQTSTARSGGWGSPTATQWATTWDRLAECESRQQWHIHTGNGYEGGLQFLNSTWLAMGGGKYARHAWQATREQQIAIAEKTLAVSSWAQQWPACSRKLGLS